SPPPSAPYCGRGAESQPPPPAYRPSASASAPPRHRATAAECPESPWQAPRYRKQHPPEHIGSPLQLKSRQTESQSPSPAPPPFRGSRLQARPPENRPCG